MKKLILFTLLIISGKSFSQAELRKADRLYEAHAYAEAAKLYSDKLEQGGTASTETFLKAADANYFVNKMRAAATFYEKAMASDATIQEPYLSRYVRSLRSVRDYEKADEIYLDYLTKTGNTIAIEKFKNEIAAFKALNESEEPSRYAVSNLNINSKYSDFVNVIRGEEVIFSSARPGAAKELYDWNEQPYLSQYVATKTETGQLANPQLFGQQISSKYHDATIAFVPNSETVYYTSSALNKNRLLLDDEQKNNFNIYKGIYKDGKITGKETLFFNSNDYSTGHPSVTSDGKYLFFASDMPGGYGEADIYYCEIFEDGKLSTPKNAGALINTAGNDFFPSMHDGELYFSSNGHLGFGGIDNYASKFDSKEGTFTKPENLGKVVNTIDDDFSIIFNEDGNSGYLSSNREGGKGDDDIYFFTRTPLPCDQFISGKIIDKLSKNVLSDATITVKDSTNIVIQTLQAEEDGTYKVKVPCDNTVTVTASKEGYIAKTETVTTGSVDGENTPELNFELNKYEDIIVKDDKGVEKIKMDPIYFDYNKADITESAAAVLNKAAEVMRDIPEMTIKIESHSDSRGPAAYNLSLSDKRAKATQQYLYSQGIAEERIESAIGYGESRLLNECADGVKCSDEQHDVNRRSDFVIIKR
ncbi:OmpA family protein [Aequorivita sp. Q41]|uniref:OmpA family protein n=1 Tax=Aequorivita sp. Q41 TaxID=3153300 RepID=UPI0032423737